MIESVLHYLRAVALFFILLFLCAVSYSEAVAHDFYEPWCCNGKDCRPYLGEVQQTPKGFFLPEFNALIPYKDAQGKIGYAEDVGTRYKVPDDDEFQYHICVMPWEPTKVRCFYARPGGV